MKKPETKLPPKPMKGQKPPAKKKPDPKKAAREARLMKADY